MVTLSTNLRNLRESARSERVEQNAGITATTVQGALEQIAGDIKNNAALEFVIDGGGQPIVGGLQDGHLEVPFACTIIRMSLVADQSGTFVLDIWKTTYANFPPTVANTITAAALPTLTAAQKVQDTTLPGWTPALSAGDWLAYYVNSNDAKITRVTVSLLVTRTL